LPFAYGTLGYEPNVQTLFGFPRAITPGGISVNVRLTRIIQALDGNAAMRPQLSLQTGIISSALEHAVPEQMLSTPTQQAEGVSAVKALQIASQQGQRIYHITPKNQAQALPNLRLDGLAMTEITSALATGKEAIVHTDRISVPGWTGEGYILFDPVTGDGAYKITGGSNGGFTNINGPIASTTNILAVGDNTIIAAMIGISAILIAYMLALVGAGIVAIALAALVALFAFGAAVALDANSLVVSLARVLVATTLLFLGPFEIVVIPFLIAVLVVAAALIRLLLIESVALNSEQINRPIRVLVA
jgi:hypothetical protein